MKKVLIHTFPVMLVFISLILINNTFNPLILKGPDFLKFYLMLVFGFYASILILQFFKERISEITYCFYGVYFFAGHRENDQRDSLRETCRFSAAAAVSANYGVLFYQIR